MWSPRYDKDPQAVLDYTLDWSAWLQTGETITSSSWFAPVGLTKDAESHTDDSATVWLSGGTASQDYLVTCEVTTSEGRTDQRSILIRCRER